jgi:hypothetical protein
VYFIIYRLFERKGLTLSESLNVVSKIQNALNAIKKEVFQRNNSFSAVKKCWPLPVLKICKVFNGESINERRTERLTLTDSFKIKYAPVISRDVDKNFLRMGRNFCFRT